MPQLLIFLTDPDRAIRRMLALAFLRAGHVVLEAKDGDGLLLNLGQVFRGANPDAADTVIVCEAQLPGRDGISVLRSVRQYPWCPPFVVLTARGDVDLHARARRVGALAVIEKPFDPAALCRSLEQVAASRRLHDPVSLATSR